MDVDAEELRQRRLAICGADASRKMPPFLFGSINIGRP